MHDILHGTGLFSSDFLSEPKKSLFQMFKKNPLKSL